MLDLETLDTCPTALVTAIGAVMFDPYSTYIGHKFYAVTTDWPCQQRKGRTISGDTVAWWLEQSDEARKALASPPFGVALSTHAALNGFCEFFDGHGGDTDVWGNGADFDNVILGSLYGSFNLTRPWTYSKNRCFRTINSLPKSKLFVKPEREGTHHNALDDAVYQARVLQAIFADQRAQRT
ncbi:MAG: 3'-5' exoribonuclease [Actinomycetota bacterium]|nr:3'-5' exoribonuclease [Actinomycetota bacterium]